MAYFNGYPATYSSPYTQLAPIQVQQPYNTAQQNGRIWVQGESGARSYLIAPNNTVDLWDSESPVIYVKSADASGMPTIKVLDYTVRDLAKNTPTSPATVVNDKAVDYATKEETKAISEQLTALRKQVERLKRKQEDEEDE